MFKVKQYGWKLGECLLVKIFKAVNKGVSLGERGFCESRLTSRTRLFTALPILSEQWRLPFQLYIIGYLISPRSRLSDWVLDTFCGLSKTILIKLYSLLIWLKLNCYNRSQTSTMEPNNQFFKKLNTLLLKTKRKDLPKIAGMVVFIQSLLLPQFRR